MRRKWSQGVFFTKEFLAGFLGSPEGGTEQEQVAAFARLRFGDNFISAHKDILFEPTRGMDVRYVLVWLRDGEPDELVAPGLTYRLLEQLVREPIPDEQLRNFYFPRCPQCKRRPTLIETKGAELFVKVKADSVTEDEDISIPRYDVLPCCSARYVMVNNGPNRKQRLAAAHEKDL